MRLEYRDLEGLEWDEKITRRDPSPVIKVEDKYYIYYSKTTSIEGFDATVWVASSEDGVVWKEECEAIGKGNERDFDGGGVFTPTTLLANGHIYLFYTAVRADFENTSTEANGLGAIGLAKSKNPLGPFEKVYTTPVLKTGDAPAFDSYRVDDTCLIKHDDKYYMFYKGRQLHRSPAETKMGLAIADHPEGPYLKYDNNPVLDSGHEVCVYPSKEGFMALVTNVGPNGNTYQYSKDGFNFNVVGSLIVPNSIGPYREDRYENNISFEMEWGVFHGYIGARPYLRRFDVIDN